jgi:hypothetical protein
LANYFRFLGHSWNKFIPSYIKGLSKGLLWELLVAYWKGDGYFGDGRRWRKKGFPICCSTASRQLACDLVEVIIKCGYAGMFSEWDRKPGNLFPNGKRSKTRRKQFNVNICRNIFPHYRSRPETSDYDDLVYCVSVPNGTILVRRKGRVVFNHQCHEGWTKKNAGWQIYRELFGDTDIPLLENGGYLDIQVGQEVYRTAHFHKLKYWSSLNKTHGGLRALDRVANADIVFTSHNHFAAVDQQNRFNPPFDKQVAIVASGTAKLQDQWQRDHFGTEGEPGGQGIMLWKDRHQFQVIYDFRVGREMMG